MSATSSRFWIDNRAETAIDDELAAPSWFSGPQFLEVERVIWCTYAPERIVVSVTVDSYERTEVDRVFRALSRNEQP